MFYFYLFFRAPKRARKWTQILAVVAVSIGAFIHGTTVTFPAVAIPSIKASNNSDNISAVEPNMYAFMPFHVYENDISLIGKTPSPYSKVPDKRADEINAQVGKNFPKLNKHAGFH